MRENSGSEATRCPLVALLSIRTVQMARRFPKIVGSLGSMTQQLQRPFGRRQSALNEAGGSGSRVHESLHLILKQVENLWIFTRLLKLHPCNLGVSSLNI